MDKWKTLGIIASLALPGLVQAESTDLLIDDSDLLGGAGTFTTPDFSETTEASWRDYFVTSLSHEQTRNDKGETKYLRYALRIEYEQAFAQHWYARLDVKGRSFRSLDEQAVQRGQAKGMLTGESYEHIKVHDAWVQYSKNACVLKAGNQTLMWGQVDGTFAVDEVTPFDFTEQLLTDYSSIRLAQPMLVSECFMDQSRFQVFYIPRALLHQLNHNDDAYGLELAAGIDDEDLDAEWGGRYEFRLGKTEIDIMYADLVMNMPAQVIPGNLPPGSPVTLIPAIDKFQLYGTSFNYASGQWQWKGDLAYKTDQFVNGTTSLMTDRIDAAFGFEFLSLGNHRLSAGLWGFHDLDDDLAPDQNNSSPFVTLSWSKSYLNDDLSMSFLANGREKPRSHSGTLQAQYKYDDYWTFSGALTLADADPAAANPIQSQENEASIQIKYQF